MSWFFLPRINWIPTPDPQEEAQRRLAEDVARRKSLVGNQYAKNRQAQLRRSPTLVLSLGDRV